MEDPSGGTTGRVKPYWSLGWMGARAEYSRWGGISAPTCIGRRGRAARSKRRANFLTFRKGIFGTGILLRRGRAIDVDHTRFIRRDGRTRRAQVAAQVATCRDIL